MHRHATPSDTVPSTSSLGELFGTVGFGSGASKFGNFEVGCCCGCRIDEVPGSDQIVVILFDSGVALHVRTQQVEEVRAEV